MALTGLMSKIGFIKKLKEETENCAIGGEVEIQDGKILVIHICNLILLNLY